MRRALLLACLMLAVLPAAGRADMSATTDATNSQTTNESTDNSSNVDLSVTQDAHTVGSASANAQVYEGVEGNSVTESGGQSTASVGDGFQDITGIVNINQSPGNNNNQANMVSFAYVESDGNLALLANGSGEVFSRNNTLNATDMERINTIDAGAFQNVSGLLQINQSAGDLNCQNNILAMAAGPHGVVALADGALGQEVANNVINEVNVRKQDIISAGAFNHVSGIVSINQSSGCGNNQTNMVVVTIQQLVLH